MKGSMEGAFLKALESSAQEFVAMVMEHQSRPEKFLLKSLLTKLSEQSASKICDALAAITTHELAAYSKLLEQEEEENAEEPTPPSAPSPIQVRRSRRERATASSRAEAATHSSGLQHQRSLKLRYLQGCATFAHLSLTSAASVFKPSWLFPAVVSLHDSLVFLEANPNLQDIISVLCEHWWHEKLDGNENLITQCLPFLVSKAVAFGRKKDVQRLYSMRHAFALFDFLDHSIEDLKHLLLRTVVTPTFLHSQPGRRFISYLFGLNPQLVKELVVIVRSQIPFGRKSILEAYGEILYHAWKTTADACLYEIEYTCIQGLIEGALHASSKELSAAIRTVLEAFTSQKAQDGVETMLFRLLEPLLFRALQVANSNVRRNALLLLVDVFPVEDPHSSNEEKESLLEKQFGLLEKLLVDPCPDVRSVAVEVVCRILRLFWEVIPSATTVKLLTKVIDEMAFDSSSHQVRVAVLKGVIYILENAQSHAILKALLPRLGFLLNDISSAVRVAAAELLLVIKGIRDIKFYKVVPMDSLLSSLSTDTSLVAQRLCKLLLPSYFPSKIAPKDACKRCVVLLKRSPEAGIQFCKWLFSQGASGTSLLELVKTLATMARDDEECSDEFRTEILHALSEVCKSMLITDEWSEAIAEVLTGDMLAALIACAPDSLARSYILQVASCLPPKDVSKLINHCADLVMKCSATQADVAEVRAVHALVLAWGGLDDLLKALVMILSESSNVATLTSPIAVRVHSSVTNRNHGNKRGKPTRPSPSNQEELKKQTQTDKFTAAVGAAWQVETLLSEDETREAVLANNHLKDVLLGLKCLAKNATKLAADSPSALTCTFYPASAILAYIKLLMHIAVWNAGEGEPNVKIPAKRSSEQSKDTRNSNAALLTELSGGFQIAWEGIIRWLREMLSKATKGPVGANSPSPQPKTKRARLPNRKFRQREPLSPLPLNGSSGAEVKVRNQEGIVKVVANIVQTTSDAFTLGLITTPTVRRESACFVSESVQWLIDSFLKNKCRTSGANSQQHLKETWTATKCLFTYAAKVLYLYVRDGPSYRVEDGLMMAHSLLDCMAILDSLKDIKPMAVSVLTSLQQWIPDLLIAVTLSSGNLRHAETATSEGPETPSIARSPSRGLWHNRHWLSYLAGKSFEVVAASDGLGTSPARNNSAGSQPTQSADSPYDAELEPMAPVGSSGAAQESCKNIEADLLTFLVRYLLKGHVQVLVGFIDVLINFASLSFVKHDLSAVIGSLDLIFTRLLMCKLANHTGLHIVLKPTSLQCLKDMMLLVSESLETTVETDVTDQSLRVINKLLTNLINHCDEFAM
ncbi:hypothetical protein R1flu_000099 [Riccia fluitans]|uniref:Condensin-2 complex subunit G2 n=1 Tax=Riccia fluitans TaxID=41844 RepID=A0ABD1Y3M8_9MARC